MTRNYKEDYRRLARNVCWATLTTPFKENGEVDEIGLRKNVQAYIDKSTSEYPIGLQACGTYGESLYMTDDERKRVTRITLEEGRGKVPVAAVVLNGDGCLKRTAEMAHYCQELGADAINVAPPSYYFHPEPEGIFQWFKALADEVEVGIVIYNLAARFNFYMDVAFIRRLAEEIPQIVGMKHAPTGLDKRLEMLRELRDIIGVIEGAEAYAPYTLPLGSPGYMSSSVLFAPDLIQRWTRAIVEKDQETVQEINQKFQAYRSLQARIPAQPPIVLKAAMDMVGLAGGYLRLPLQPLGKTHRRELHLALVELGLELV